MVENEAQGHPQNHKKRAQKNSEKMYAKSLRVAATKLRLRRRPPTKEDPQKENHTRTNATFLRSPITPGRLRPGADFWMHFGRILHPFWRPKCIQNGVRNGKCVFLVLSVSCRRELNLGGFGTPKSIKMMSENRMEN